MVLKKPSWELVLVGFVYITSYLIDQTKWMFNRIHQNPLVPPWLAKLPNVEKIEARTIPSFQLVNSTSEAASMMSGSNFLGAYVFQHYFQACSEHPKYIPNTRRKEETGQDNEW